MRDPLRLRTGEIAKKGTTGFEPVTRGSAIHCSATELCTRMLDPFYFGSMVGTVGGTMS